MIIANRPLNLQAIAVEEAETKIRKTVKEEFFRRTPKAEIDRKVFKHISEAERQIRIPELAVAARQSLLRFYTAQFQELRISFGWQLPLLAALFLLNGKTLTGREIKPTQAQTQQARQILEQAGYDRSRLLGSPLQKFSKDYVERNVKPALDRLAKQQARDPDDVSGRNTLRNKAEMAVRYNEHLKQIEGFKKRGVNLVICSTHADCSERCAPWQGLVYSLDGTEGYTDDGRHYQPLENATHDQITKRGVPNGLLGYNCRHFLVPYKSGYRFPKPHAVEEREEYKITQIQRRMEADVRKWRAVAIENKDTDRDRYLEARRKAIAANQAYIEFSKRHNRAYYPSRTKLI